MSEAKLEAAMNQIERLTQRVNALEKDRHALSRIAVEHECMMRMALSGQAVTPWGVKILNFTDGPAVEFKVVDRHSQKQEEDAGLRLATPKESQIIGATKNRKG